MERSFILIAAAMASVVIGCGDDGTTPTPDSSVDAGEDSGGGGDSGGIDCTGAADGTPCAGDQICLRSDCVPSRCGDGYVDEAGTELCDDGNDIPGDGCEPSVCVFTCSDASHCDNGNPCDGAETCNAALHRCQAAAPVDGGMCTLMAGGDGVCSGGTCAPPGCGNSVTDALEECDDGMDGDDADGCTDACQFTCDAETTCSDANACNGEEVCDMTTHTCGPGTALDCDDSDPCTADSCDGAMGCVQDFIDTDSDGYAPGTCTTAGLMGGDCDDVNFTIHPGGTELCDGLDNDCDGAVDDGTVDITCYYDGDRDTWGNDSRTVTACTCPANYIARGGDCADTVASVNPDHTDWETRPFTVGRTSSFDWNCSGVEEKRWTTISSGACSFTCGGLFCACVGGGWISSAPACGTPTGIGLVNYRSCSLLGGSCRESLIRRTQECH